MWPSEFIGSGKHSVKQPEEVGPVIPVTERSKGREQSLVLRFPASACSSDAFTPIAVWTKAFDLVQDRENDRHGGRLWKR
jgi:hypothetical protein